MNDKNVEILLVEDNPNDELLALHAFKKHNLANKILSVKTVLKNVLELLQTAIGRGQCIYFNLKIK